MKTPTTPVDSPAQKPPIANKPSLIPKVGVTVKSGIPTAATPPAPASKVGQDLTLCSMHCV